MNHPIAYVARLVSEYRRFILEKLSKQSVGRFLVCAGTFRDPSFEGLSRGLAPGYRCTNAKIDGSATNLQCA